jgi:hypothetical protein
VRLRRSPAKADEARHCVERERCPDETAPASRGVFTAIAVRLGTHPHASNVPEAPLYCVGNGKLQRRSAVRRVRRVDLGLRREDGHGAVPQRRRE